MGRVLYVSLNTIDIAEASVAFENGVLPMIIFAGKEEKLPAHQENYQVNDIDGERVVHCLELLKPEEALSLEAVIMKDGTKRETLSTTILGDGLSIKVRGEEEDKQEEISVSQKIEEELKSIRETAEKKPQMTM